MTSHPDSTAVPPPGCPAHNGGGLPLYGPDFTADPAHVYERLRRQGPVAPAEILPGVDVMLVTGYRAALQVLRTTDKYGKDSRRWRALNEGRVPADSLALQAMAPRPNCQRTEGAEHARLRAAVSDAFQRVDVLALREHVERTAGLLIDGFATKGEADLLNDYAKPLSAYLLTALFGCPPEYSDRVVAATTDLFDGVEPGKADNELVRCMADMIALKRARPGEDVTTWLVQHRVQLSVEELIHQLIVIMASGYEQEQNLIANTLRLLLSDERFAGSVGDGRLLVEDALSEVLWTDPPMANYAVHYPYVDTTLEGVPLQAGEPVVISFAAANNDPALAGSLRTGNRAHLAWGAGPHRCPAREPAHVIASVAIECVLDRLPDLSLAVPAEQLTWRPSPFTRGLVALPVTFPPAVRATPAPTGTPVPASPPSPDRGSGDTRRTTGPAPAPDPAPPSSAHEGADSSGREPDSRDGARRWASNPLARWWHGR
ncbi:cytochrome P450 [Streptomyces sp. M2CJ-2]|uniref:cytochrome P450 n=1 Tax=Streptomyces sp. M2CJ-2 TaxID=2803948 RepID=UPI0019259CE0|nr:cytochrome P450 [Streptomyces sp. M2CJ-2]MBL3666821.1 cytochrome P450 [Streptomyces sp. M2CJ-2]